MTAPPAPPMLRAPRWLDEIDITLPVCAQYALYGNIRDTFLFHQDGAVCGGPLATTLWSRLASNGYSSLFLYSRHGGLELYSECDDDAARPILQQFAGTAGDGQGARIQLLPRIIQAVGEQRGMALVIEDASRLISSPNHLSEAELVTFGGCVRAVRAAQPRPVSRPDGRQRNLYSPTFWLADRIGDLPDWLVVGDERARAISIALPDRETRLACVRPQIDGDPDGSVAERIAALTDALMLREVSAVASIARDQAVPPERIGDAVRAYTVGIADNPWGQHKLRDDIGRAEAALKREVIGQDAAVDRVLDVLKSSVLGLHGAQAASSSRRPRGTLFFAGPTGVGKTELAKAMSRLLFGDSDNFFRLDMSEFSAEHSEARLIGAPPGYVGHDQGGELVNAIRERPFRVVLFDEIEKAHPRILDKFLQILEDGRLTDGRGDTVYFSEALLVFTSNLGVMREERDAVSGVVRKVPAIDTNDTPERVRDVVTAGIRAHFVDRLERPELLNRLGENIVVFDFIREEAALAIFDLMLKHVCRRVREQCGVALSFTPSVEVELRAACTANRSMGARGIGNQIEQRLVKPLAGELFDFVDASRTTPLAIRIRTAACDAPPYRLELEVEP